MQEVLRINPLYNLLVRKRNTKKMEEMPMFHNLNIFTRGWLPTSTQYLYLVADLTLHGMNFH